jgi:class 3 adenylate cyclase
MASDLANALRGLHLKRSSLNYVPDYAIGPTITAIQQVRELEQSQLLRPGLYYLVLIDLVGSTESSAKIGVDENVKRIEEFVRFTVEALGRSALLNSAYFVKEIGDASLLLFSSFGDVLRWRDSVETLFAAYNAKLVKGKLAAHYRMAGKVVVHLGEVAFSEARNPIALAVNQLFKIEKNFRGGEIGCTDVVRRAILPRVSSGELQATEVNRVTLPGEDEESPIWRLLPQLKKLHTKRGV